MHVGIGPLGDLPETRGPPAVVASEVVETAALAEALGFESAWVGERHLAPETATASAPFALLSAMAAATEHLRLGTAVALVPLHHPLRLVEQVATVDALSDGRVTVGTGIGYMADEFDAFGVDPARRVGHLLDAVDLFRAAGTGDPISYEGRVHDVDGVRVQPAFTQDPGPPIWMGGTVPAAMERAARVGDGFLGIPAGPDFYRRAREVLEDAADDYDALATGAMVNALVAESTEAAREAVRPGLEALEARYARWQDRDRRPIDPAAEPGAFGTPAEVAGALAEYEAILGDDVHLLVRLHYADVPRERSDEAMERFADEVLPAL